jgi:hypothetical protein
MAMLRDRAVLVRAMDVRLSDLDALVLPTTPIVAPMVAEVASSEGFAAKNGMVLRNPAIVNFFDLCAISLPLPRAGGLPVGLMLVARNGHDRRLFNGGCGRTRSGSVTDTVLITGDLGRLLRARRSGHTAAPPSSVMNARRCN